MNKLTEGLALKYAENRKILILHIYSFNIDFSLTMRLICLKAAIHVPETHLEGTVSQNFDTGLSLNLIACRSREFKRITKKYKSYPFFALKIKLGPEFKI